MLIGLLIGLPVGIVFAYVVLTVGTPPPALAWADTVYNPRLMLGEPPLPIPPLSAIIGGAETDADALSAIVSYYNRQSLRLAVLFREDNEQRTRALFGMYIVHMAAPYNVTPVTPVTFLDFVRTPTAHCGIYARAQSQVYTALGLRWREVHVDGGWHGLIEAEISGFYEVFDSTSAVWVNQPVESLLRGAERHYRAYYTPALDANAAAVYRDHLQAGYSVPELRAGLPLWGIAIHPRTAEIVAQSG